MSRFTIYCDSLLTRQVYLFVLKSTGFSENYKLKIIKEVRNVAKLDMDNCKILMKNLLVVHKKNT